jgi:predicted DNA binding CopG/RHH family protein
VEKPMNTPKIPRTDSIEELARFWDTHDLTDFEDELEEVTEPIFERTAMVKIHLQPKEMEALKEIAHTRGLGAEELIREWILEKIGNS